VEFIILAGIDVKKITAGKQEIIRRILNQRLADLDRLVTNRIDWERDGKQNPIERMELADWFQEDFEKLNILPAMSNFKADSFISTLYRGAGKFLKISIYLAISGIVIFFGAQAMLKWRPTTSKPQEKDPVVVFLDYLNPENRPLAEQELKKSVLTITDKKKLETIAAGKGELEDIFILFTGGESDFNAIRIDLRGNIKPATTPLTPVALQEAIRYRQKLRTLHRDLETYATKEENVRGFAPLTKTGADVYTPFFTKEDGEYIKDVRLVLNQDVRADDSGVADQACRKKSKDSLLNLQSCFKDYTVGNGIIAKEKEKAELFRTIVQSLRELPKLSSQAPTPAQSGKENDRP